MEESTAQIPHSGHSKPRRNRSAFFHGCCGRWKAGGVACAAPEARQTADDCELIFHRNGRRLGDFYTSWVRAIDRAEVPHFTIHDLRRTAARNMRRAGIVEPTAMLIMGHETNSMFKRYSITDERDLEDTMTKRAAYEATLPRKSAKTPTKTVSDFRLRNGK